ncbi:immunoglobulin-like domain-containing protein [Listeria cornellensis]|uniref:Putative peptidoglycan linked protein n=1 Tax=Listeria cornellensis FSL F6-0969 TaxID=1265820 RepID=W7BUX2_9LIST|nr:immunoglobulin-like domain-containing protein [Listeria cornellensis]EUJ30529.1 putative peptidoglycan linked protein [Listeria cornellensis FSL F6-0969]
MNSKKNYEGVKAADGDQYAELNATMISALYQDIETTPGTKIRWKVSHRGRDGVDTAEVRFGAPGQSLELMTTMSTDNKAWKEYQGTYTIPEGQTTTRFEFKAISSTGGDLTRGNYLDNIVFSSPSNLNVEDSFSQPTVKKGKQVDYLVNVTNNGGMVAENVNLAIPLPKELDYIPDTVTVNGVTTSDVLYDAASHSLTVSVASISDGSTAKISVGLKGITETASAQTSVATSYYDLGFTDQRYDANTANASVAVIKNEVPVIAASDKNLKIGTAFNPLTDVSANDPEDGDVTSKITVTANDVDTSKIGTYHVTYSVTDSDGNTTTKTITVTVSSNNAPTIVATDKTMKKGVSFNPLVGVSASDTEDGDVTSKITVTSNDVDTSRVGTYHVTYSVTDSDGNTTTKTITVTVTSNDAPTIIATDKTMKKGAAFNPLTGVSASDVEDGDMTSKITITANDVNTAKVGTYHVTYSVTDSDGNTTAKTITVTVTSNDAPTITATDKTMKKGRTFNPYTDVTANDTEDGDLSLAVSVIANDVNTNQEGMYHVTYSVTDSDGNTTTKTITVTVTSNNAPVIQASNITMRVHQAFDVRAAVTATDTEDGNLTNKIQVTANDVNIDKAGVYHVTYSVTDSDGNTTKKTITVTVLTNDAPILTTSDVYLKVGDTFEPLTGITASDLEDGNVTSKIKVMSNTVDMTQAGTYSVTYSVTDSDNNTTTIKRHVYVRTNDKPEIHASDQTFKAGYAYDAMQGVSASDTEDGDVTSKVKVTANDVDASKAGTYHVTYSVTDSDGNTTEQTVTITVLTNEKPVITASDITQKAHRALDPMTGVSANDLEDGDVTANVKVVANDVNIDVPGEYHITYSVLDSDGNTTEKTIMVTILSNDAPEIQGQDSSFKAGRAFNPMAGITATDTEDGDVTANIQIIANDVNPDVAGVYHVTYSITDSDGNTTEQTYTVTVLTNEKPVIHASDQALAFGQAFDPMAGVSAEDLEDGDLTSHITIVSNDVNTQVPGIYHVTYSVIDSDGNETQYTITVLVGAQPIAPVDPVVPVDTVKPVAPVHMIVQPEPTKTVQAVTPIKDLPKTGDTDNTKTLVFGGFLAALGALFLRRKK